jgi:protein-histidine N-methyltransferase
LAHSPSSFAPEAPSLCGNGGSATVLESDGDLEVTPELLQAFQDDLVKRDITLNLISGPWNPETLPSMIPTHPNMSVLILAAETIYSPASLDSFTTTLLQILRKVRMAKALVAAKRVYFGVGGSVDDFKGKIGDGGGVVAEVENSGIEGCDRSYMGGRGGVSGVGRCLMEVQMC